MFSKKALISIVTLAIALMAAYLLVDDRGGSHRNQQHGSSSAPESEALAAQGAPAQSTPPSAESQPSIELITNSTGVEPRFQLGFRFPLTAPSTTTKMRIRFLLRGSNSGEPTPELVSPWVSSDLITTIGEVLPDGSAAQITLKVSNIVVPEMVEAEEGFTEQIKHDMSQLEGMTCSGTLGKASGLTALDCDFPNRAEEGGEQLYQVADTLASLYIGFPKDPLGRGGSWSEKALLPDSQVDEASSPQASGVVTNYLLDEVSAGGARISAKSRVEIPPQDQIIALEDGSEGQISLIRGEITFSSSVTYRWDSIQVAGSVSTIGVQEISYPNQDNPAETSRSTIETGLELELGK